MPLPTQAEIQASNQRFLDQLNSPHTKEAAVETAQTYTKYRVREDGVARAVQPPVKIGNEDLRVSTQYEDLVVVVEREPDVPAAVTVPFSELPMGIEIYGQRYEVAITRIQTNKFQKNVDLLRTYKYDLREMFASNSLKELMTEEDNKWFAAVDAAMGGAQDTVVELSGTVQWQGIPSPVTRAALEDAFKILPKTPSRLEVASCVVNNIFVREIMKIGRDEMGGDYSQELFRTGKFKGEFMGVNWLATIKHEIVGDDSLYMFAAPDYLGKFFELEGPTAYVERRYFYIEFFHSELVGAAIGNTNAVARADFGAAA